MTYSLKLADVAFIGAGLNRPECVLATRTGDLYTSDGRGGVAHVKPDGTSRLYAGTTADLPEGPRPNGIALEPDGSFLFANLGTTAGGIWRLTRQGQVSPVIRRVDGVDLPPSNYCGRDANGRLWATISTRVVPRALDYRLDAKLGFIVLDDGRGARIVADGLGFTNECYVDPTGQWLYVNETYGRRLSRFPLRANCDLGPKEVVAQLGYGQYPDGFAFDVNGDAWITGVISNQLIHVATSGPAMGRATVVLEDSDAGHVAWVEAALQQAALTRPHLDTIKSARLRNISNIAFGGPDLRTAYLGCLLGTEIATLRMPVAGVKPVHWEYPLAG